MFPVYRFMDPYFQTLPQQRDPNSYPCQYYPSWEAMPSQVKAESFKHPSVFVPAPFTGNPKHPSVFVPAPFTGNPSPADHNGFCHHNCSPGYYSFKPPFSHVQPSQMYYYGPYPPYSDGYPAYLIPPPHYSADQAHYDYDKVRNHCCGCPNHTCHRRDDSLPKIEEQEAEKVQDGESSSLIQLPNYPYPVVWVPPSYMKDRKDDKTADLQPGRWNGWIPLDIGCLKGLKQEDEKKRSRHAENKRTQSQSPFPIIWMPGYDKPEEGGYDKPEEAAKDVKENTPKSVEEWPSKFKIVPLKLLENQDRGEKPRVENDEQKNQVQREASVEKESKTKTIPVRHFEEGNQQKISMPEKPEGEADDKKSTISEKRKEESEGKKASEKKQSSPVRSSKLPPVCLRVDPLPKRKATNGTSRSPSPPGLKEKRDHPHNAEQTPQKDTNMEIHEKDIPVFNVKNKSSSQAEKEPKCQENVQVISLDDSSQIALPRETSKSDESLKVKVAVEGRKGGEKKDSEEWKSAEREPKIEADEGHVQSSENKRIEEKKERRRELSQSDAAVIIQSAYRGFEVRRWQALEKLRKIAKIREKVGDIRRQIQRIEASSQKQDAKRRVVISETIMNLLLLLDTIQGLHPSVREVRKSVARELVCLQEKLDMLGTQFAERQESMKVEEEMIDKNVDGETACVSSCPEVESTSGQDSSKQEFLKERIDSIASVATKEPAQVEENFADSPFNDEIVFIATPSLVTEPASEHDSVQPADEKGVVPEPSLESEESDRSLDNNIAVVASPSLLSEQDADPFLVAEPASEQVIVQPTEDNSAANQPFLENKEIGSDQERHEDKTGGEREVIHFEIEVPVDSELVNNSPCKNEESANALVSAEEGGSKLSSEDSCAGLGVKELLEPLWEVNYQEHEAVELDSEAEGDARSNQEPKVQTSKQGSSLEEGALIKAEEMQLIADARDPVVLATPVKDKYDPELMSSLEQMEEADNAQEKLDALPSVDGIVPMETSAGVDDVDDMHRDDLVSPKLAVEVDNVEGSMLENLEMSATDNEVSSLGVPECGGENGVEVAGQVVEGSIEGVLLSASETPEKGAISEVVDTSVVEQDLSDMVLDERSSMEPSLEAATKETEAPEKKEEGRALTKLSSDMIKEEKKLLEDNEKLREMLEKLLDAGKEQLGVISNLNERVKGLERKLAQKKRVKVRRNRPVK